jgi:superfamily II DNA/RNA helicase
MKFSDLGLGPDVLRAVEEAGYSQPTPIQEQAIPVVLQGRDVLGCAQTGTGKTASFTLPMIDILAAGQPKARMPRSLIIEPTRELASQVSENFEVYGKFHKLSMALLIGGVSFDEQDRRLDRGVAVLIAPPGRLLDHFERGKVLLRGVKVLVIDEADRMLDMGFIPDVERIVSLLPTLRQTLFFSATMPPEIRRLADAFLMNPKEIAVSPPTTPAETVVQGLAVLHRNDKREALRSLIRSQNVKNALIFCNRKRDVDTLFSSLKKHGFDVKALHGDLSQPVRTETLESFKAGEFTLLVASDVAARGLDIKGMSHVFNFDVPMHAEDYIHRIGRTGRAGLPGKAYTLATPEDGRFVAAITHLIGKDIPRIDVGGMAKEELGEDERGERGRPRRGRGGRARGGARRDGTRGGAKAEATSPPRSERAEEPVEAAKPKPARKPRAKPEAKPEAKRKSEAKPRKKETTEPVVGMGGHVPAFMQREGRPKKKPAQKK